jgi:hypothetical protein
MTRRCVLLVATLLLGLALPRLTLAQATVEKSRTRSPFNMTLQSCPDQNEPVSIEGEELFILETVLDANGGLHSQLRITAHGRGFGLTSGKKYQFYKNESFLLNAGSEECSQLDMTGIQEFRLISQGGSDNGKVQSTFHLTMNANCELTAFVDNAHTECQ